MVNPPTIINVLLQSAVAPRMGKKRAKIYTPAFTIVAECRYADTGVGAFIAPGSQKWKGNCADLVNAPRKINPTNNGYKEWLMIISRRSINSLMMNVSAILPNNSNPAKRKNPPIPVMLNAVMALFRESLLSLLKPIRKKELILVNSQKI